MVNNIIYKELSEELLKSNKFFGLYKKVLLSQYYLNSTNHLDVEEIKYLLQSASIFSFSVEEHKQVAYKIATILSETYSEMYDNINMPIQYILLSSGQLPVIKKNITECKNDYFSLYSAGSQQYNPMIFRNVILKKVSNELPVSQNDNNYNNILLTDFQNKIFRDLVKGKSISVSAPTSAGKSFLLKAFISKKFSENNVFNVVYIVPTRALIAQVQKDFKLTLKEHSINDVEVLSTPEIGNDTFLKRLFILTQERFHNLLFDIEFKQPLNVLIIDEAHNVSDVSRGILLEEVIEEAIKRNKKLKEPL